MTLLLAFLLLEISTVSMPARSHQKCQFVLGFKALQDLIGHEIVGDYLGNEHYNAIGDSVQCTTDGMLVWCKADN
ncbi:MAG: hypothetical protein OXE05_12550 [Chloroflexi bacterium]|nr:hypothetical protein [Chloroflexota bacterium]